MFEDVDLSAITAMEKLGCEHLVLLVLCLVLYARLATF